MTNKRTWVIDPTHSDIQFKIRHLVISTVTGFFRTFEGKAVTEGDGFENAKVSITIDVKSIDTNQANRDSHLQNGDFFSSDEFPNILFASTSFTKIKDTAYKMTGDLTLRGVTKPVYLHL